MANETIYNPGKESYEGILLEKAIKEFPELDPHFAFNNFIRIHPDLFPREYNVLGGMNVADVTEGTKIGDSLTLSALGGIYSLVDSLKDKNQDFFSIEGGIGDYARNTLGILIQNNNPLANLFLSKKEIQKYKNLYKKMQNEIARDTKDEAKVKH